MRIPSGDEDRFGFLFGVRDSILSIVGDADIFSQAPCQGAGKKFVDSVLLAYEKFPIPDPCYNGRKSMRFWSSVMAGQTVVKQRVCLPL